VARNTVEIIVSVLDKASSELAGVVGQEKALRDALRDSQGAMKTLRDEYRAGIVSQQQYKEGLESAKRGLTELASKTDVASDGYRLTAASAAQAGDALNKLEREAKGLNLTSQLEKANDKLDQIDKKAGGLGASLKGAFAAAGAAIAGSALVSELSNMANAAIETGGNLVDLSNKTGFAIETLSRFDYISTQAGGSSEALAQAASVLGKKMFDLDGPSKAAKNALDELGISAKNSNGTLKTSEELFLEVTDGLAGVKDQTRQAAIANELFGKKAQDVLQPIRDLGTGFGDAAKEADRLGVTMSGDQARAFDTYGDTIAKVKAQFQGLVSQGLSAIMPYLNQLVTALSNGITWFTKAREGSAGFGAAISGAGSIVSQFVKMARPLLESFGELAVEMFKASAFAYNNVLKPAFNAIAPLLRQVFSSASDIIKALVALMQGDFGKARDLAIKAFEGLYNEVKAIFGRLYTAALDVGRDVVRGMVGGITEGIGRVINAAKNLGQSAIDAASKVLRIGSPSKEFEQLGKWSAEGYSNGLSNSNIDPAVVGFVKKFYGTFKGALAAGFNDYEVLKAIWPENFADALFDKARPKMQNFGTNIGTTTGNAFVDAFLERANELGDKLRGTVKSAAGSLQMAAMDPLPMPTFALSPITAAPATAGPALDLGTDSFFEPQFVQVGGPKIIQAVEMLTNVIRDLPQQTSKAFGQEAGTITPFGFGGEAGTIDLGVSFGQVAGDLANDIGVSFGNEAGVIFDNTSGATTALTALTESGNLLENELHDFTQTVIALNNDAKAGNLAFTDKQGGIMPSPIEATLGTDYLKGGEGSGSAPAGFDPLSFLLAPLLEFGKILEAINPVANLVAGVMEALQPAITALQVPMKIAGQILGTLLVPVFQLLFPIIKGLALLFAGFAIVIGEVWNAIANLVRIVTFGAVDLRISTGDLYKQFDELKDLTFEQAQNYKKLNSGQQQAINAPQGYNYAAVGNQPVYVSVYLDGQRVDETIQYREGNRNFVRSGNRMSRANR
jgi:hypothetical protein